VRYFFRVEYDGTSYGGWQRQPNAVSVQEKLELAFGVALRTKIDITGAGRTDAGVHGRAQGAHFDCDQEFDLSRLELSVNAILPHEISIYNLCPVDNAFHARFTAVSRRYKYTMCLRKMPLLYKRVWMIFTKVDWDLVNQNATQLIGRHDFETFCASGATSDNTICTVTGASLDKFNECIVFTIEADRFIYRMVRSVVGTLIDIGRGKINQSMAEIIASRDRKKAGSTAPACGLVLDYVKYPVELLDESK
jgi:tRNA pseudouridine38-40 synthase